MIEFTGGIMNSRAEAFWNALCSVHVRADAVVPFAELTAEHKRDMERMASEYDKATRTELPADVEALVSKIENRGGAHRGEISQLIAIVREYQRNHAFTMREWEHDAVRANAAENERDRLRERLAKLETCIVCGSHLPPSESPPHCSDTCTVDEEHEAEWEAVRASFSKPKLKSDAVAETAHDSDSTDSDMPADMSAFLANVESHISFMNGAEKMSLDVCDVPRLIAIVRERSTKLAHARRVLRRHVKLLSYWCDANNSLRKTIAKLEAGKQAVIDGMTRAIEAEGRANKAFYEIQAERDALSLAIREYFATESRSDTSPLAARNKLRELVGLPAIVMKRGVATTQEMTDGEK